MAESTAGRASAGRSPAATMLIEAARTGVPCDPIRTLMPDGTVDDAYAVQQEVNNTDPGRRVVGHKIGLTAPAVQRQMGVDRPDFGVLFGDTASEDGDEIGAHQLIQPRVEAEVAFILEHDLPERPLEVADVVHATAYVVAALEIVDSRIRDWDIGILDTVADNASSGRFVLGTGRHLLRDLDDLSRLTMTLRDEADVEVSSGTGADCLGHPANAVVWLANEMYSRGVPLRAGEVILSGSLGPLVPARRGARYRATVSQLGSVQVGFAR